MQATQISSGFCGTKMVNKVRSLSAHIYYIVCLKIISYLSKQKDIEILGEGGVFIWIFWDVVFVGLCFLIQFCFGVFVGFFSVLDSSGWL